MQLIKTDKIKSTRKGNKIIVTKEAMKKSLQPAFY